MKKPCIFTCKTQTTSSSTCNCPAPSMQDEKLRMKLQLKLMLPGFLSIQRETSLNCVERLHVHVCFSGLQRRPMLCFCTLFTLSATCSFTALYYIFVFRTPRAPNAHFCSKLPPDIKKAWEVSKKPPREVPPPRAAQKWPK